jgi:hypothetical protein
MLIGDRPLCISVECYAGYRGDEMPLRFRHRNRLIETTEIIVRRVGGQVTEGNLQFSTTVNVYPESESFKVGEEIVAFLLFDMSERVYVFTNGPFSAFK